MTVAEIRIEINKKEDVVSNLKKEISKVNQQMLNIDSSVGNAITRTNAKIPYIKLNNELNILIDKIKKEIVDLENKLNDAKNLEKIELKKSLDKIQISDNVTKSIALPTNKITLIEEPKLKEKVEEVLPIKEDKSDIKTISKMSLTTKIILTSVGVLGLVGIIILLKRKK
jgi:hypothetical protein